MIQSTTTVLLYSPILLSHLNTILSLHCPSLSLLDSFLPFICARYGDDWFDGRTESELFPQILGGDYFHLDDPYIYRGQSRVPGCPQLTTRIRSGQYHNFITTNSTNNNNTITIIIHTTTTYITTIASPPLTITSNHHLQPPLTVTSNHHYRPSSSTNHYRSTELQWRKVVCLPTSATGHPTLIQPTPFLFYPYPTFNPLLPHFQPPHLFPPPLYCFCTATAYYQQ